MATREDLQPWILDALRHLGLATVPQIAKYIWDSHERELRQSGDLFYTWQYAMRWAGQKLQMAGKLRKKGAGRTWYLV